MPLIKVGMLLVHGMSKDKEFENTEHTCQDPDVDTTVGLPNKRNSEFYCNIIK